jgi:hypothetical protein
MRQFLDNPAIGSVEAYILMPGDFPDDVVITLDQEFMEGVVSPVYVSGGDWMSLIGLQRTGTLWIAAGTDATMTGLPSTSRSWEFLDLGMRLSAGVWYRIRITSNFATRHFESFTITGLDINRTVDLSQYKLDYPNYAPFNEASMAYYVGAMRYLSLVGTTTETGAPSVLFDDVTASVSVGGIFTPAFSNSFEQQTIIGSQPLTSPVIDLSNYVQGLWYKERDEALFGIVEVGYAHSGSNVGIANATLQE